MGVRNLAQICHVAYVKLDVQQAERPAIVDIAGGGRVLIVDAGLRSAGVPPQWAATDARAGVAYVGDLYGKADTQFDEVLAKRGITSKELHAGISDTSAVMFLDAEKWIRKDQIEALKTLNG